MPTNPGEYVHFQFILMDKGAAIFISIQSLRGDLSLCGLSSTAHPPDGYRNMTCAYDVSA